MDKSHNMTRLNIVAMGTANNPTTAIIIVTLYLLLKSPQPVAKNRIPKMRYMAVANSAIREPKIDAITPVKLYMEAIIMIPSTKNKMCRSGTPPILVAPDTIFINSKKEVFLLAI